MNGDNMRNGLRQSPEVKGSREGKSLVGIRRQGRFYFFLCVLNTDGRRSHSLVEEVR